MRVKSVCPNFEHARKSICRGIPVGCTLHRVSAVLDGGELIERTVIDVKKGMSLDDVVYRTCELAGEQSANALHMLRRHGTLKSMPFPEGSAGPNFRWSNTIEQKARDVLEEGSYFFVDKTKGGRLIPLINSGNQNTDDEPGKWAVANALLEEIYASQDLAEK